MTETHPPGAHESGRHRISGRADWQIPRINGVACGPVEKALHSCDKVFFLHMRKAAGTSIRNLLTTITNRSGLELNVQEGGVLDHDKMGGAKTFRVTCLREPLDRVCSLYNFQGRWAGRDQPQAQSKARPFAEWLEQIPTPNKWRLWDESADYYTKTLSGGPVDQRGKGVEASHYSRARQVLDTFDLVLIVEGFGLPEYDAWLSRRLGLEKPIAMPTKRPTTKVQSKYDIRQHLTDDMVTDVQTCNRWDLELYRRACGRAPVAPRDKA